MDILDLLKEYSLEEIDAKEFKKMKISGMKFNVTSYKVKDFGFISIMKASGMLGLMKMDTIVFSPTLKDAPLLSYDRIFALGNDTLILELFNTMKDNAFDEKDLLAIKEEAKVFMDRETKPVWYEKLYLNSIIEKKGKKKQSKDFDLIVEKYIKTYMRNSMLCKDINEGEKQKINAEYSNGLIENGGPSTDVFIKAIGKEKTKQFFEEVLFHTN